MASRRSLPLGRRAGARAVIAVNGRAMARPTTGVERVAASVYRHLAGPDVQLIVPEVRAPVSGHLWEQMVLPARARGTTLWSPANSGPLWHRRQLLTLHDASVWDHPEWFSRSYASWFRALVPRLVRRVAAVMTVSEFSAQRIMAHTRVPRSKLAVVPLATETLSAEPPPGAPSTGTPSAEPSPGALSAGPAGGGDGLPEGLERGGFVLTVGSLEPRKNLARLLEAWRMAKRDRGGVRLVVVGGSGSATLRRVAMAADDSVITLGHVDDVALAALYRGCLGFAFPSLYEGFGLPPVEAAAYGCRLVTSDLPPVREVLGPGPIYAEPTSVESLADGLRALMRGTSEGRPEHLPRRTWAQVAEEVGHNLRSI